MPTKRKSVSIGVVASRRKCQYVPPIILIYYLGSDINKEGRIQKEISRRIQNSAKCYH